MSRSEIDECLHHFMAFQFEQGLSSMTNSKCFDENLKIGDQTVEFFPLVGIDEINMPNFVRLFLSANINSTYIATDLFSFLAEISYTDYVIYNQVIQILAQRRLMYKPQNRAKYHDSMPDPSGRIAKKDIKRPLDALVMDSRLTIYTNFSILVSYPHDRVTPVTSYIRTKLYDYAIMPSRSTYNQLELFMCNFPGNGYVFNPDCDPFLTPLDTTLYLYPKERPKHPERTPLETYYTGG